VTAATVAAASITTAGVIAVEPRSVDSDSQALLPSTTATLTRWAPQPAPEVA